MFSSSGRKCSTARSRIVALNRRGIGARRPWNTSYATTFSDSVAPALLSHIGHPERATAPAAAFQVVLSTPVRPSEALQRQARQRFASVKPTASLARRGEVPPVLIRSWASNESRRGWSVSRETLCDSPLLQHHAAVARPSDELPQKILVITAPIFSTRMQPGNLHSGIRDHAGTECPFKQ